MADIKRMRYFDQQLLVLKDFTDEQDYHVEMRRRHNRSLHTPGVGSGLDVAKTGVKEVTVKAGMAIDNLGREIALDADTKIDLSNATLFPPASSILVTISYVEEQIDPSASDTTQNTRIREKFNLAATRETAGNPPDSSAVQLARVILDAQGNVGTLDLTVRRLAGASAFDNPEANFTARSLRLSNPAFPNTQWPVLTASGPNQVTVGGSLLAQSFGAIGDINLNGSLKAGGDLSGRTLSLTGALSVPNATINVALSVGGSLVIGTGNPQAKLQVAAGAIVPSAGNSPQAGIQFPPNPGGGAGDEAFIRYFATAGETTKLQIGIGNDVDDAIGLVQAGAERLTIINGNVGIGIPNPDASLRVKQIASALALKVTANRSEADGFKQPIAEFKHENETQGVGIGYASVYATGSNANQILSIFARGTGALILNAEGGGNVGIGIPNPDATLRVKETASALALKVTANRSEADTFKQPIAEFKHENETQGVGIGYASVYATGSNANQILSIFARGTGALILNAEGGGNVGIGTSAPDRKLTIDQPGPATGVYANIKNDTHEILFGVDQAAIVSAMKASDLQFRTNNVNRMVINANSGNVGIGINNPAFKLDIGDRMRVRGGPAGTAGIFFTGSAGVDRGFTGLSDDNHVGFWGVKAGWGVLMDVETGALRVNGLFTAAGGKVGYVVDQFINKLGETVEEGDVVVIGQNQSILFYGQHENIPIPEIDLAQSAYQTSVCGIVCETHGELRPQPEDDEGGKAKGARKSKKPVIAPQAFTNEEMKGQERTQVQPDQIGLMVTLGAFAHCKVDADIAPIKVGDLLTTSPTKGHAQKVLDPSKAIGAIIGKALGSLRKGKGKIPVLVMLQ